MDKERGPAVNIGLEQTHAFIRRIPALHDDIVELIAQEFVDHALILTVNFEEIGECADGRKAAAQRVRTKKLAHRVRRVAMLADERVEGIMAASERGMFGAKLITPPPGLGFRRAFRVNAVAKACDLSLTRLEGEIASLRDGINAKRA